MPGAYWARAWPRADMPKSTAELEWELNQALQDKKVLEAFEQFYVDDVVMQENSGEPCRGKEANRQRTLEWAGRSRSFTARG